MIADIKRFSPKTGQNTRITVQGLGASRENDMSDEREAIDEAAPLTDAEIARAKANPVKLPEHAATALLRGDHLAPKE